MRIEIKETKKEVKKESEFKQLSQRLEVAESKRDVKKATGVVSKNPFTNLIVLKYLDINYLKSHDINPADILIDLLSRYLESPSTLSGKLSASLYGDKRPLDGLRKAMAEAKLDKSSKTASDKKEHKEKGPVRQLCPLSIEKILGILNNIDPRLLDTDPYLWGILNGFFEVYPKYIEAVPNLQSKLEPNKIYECPYIPLVANVFSQITSDTADQIIIKREGLPPRSVILKWASQHSEDPQARTFPYLDKTGWGIFPFNDKIKEISGLNDLQRQLAFLPEIYHVETYLLLLNRLTDEDTRVRYIACKVAEVLIPQLKINTEQQQKITHALLNCIESDDVSQYMLGCAASDALVALPVPIKQKEQQDRVLRALEKSLLYDHGYNVTQLRHCLVDMCQYLDEKQITQSCTSHLKFVLAYILHKPTEHLFLGTFYYSGVFKILLPNSSPSKLVEYWEICHYVLNELMTKSDAFTATNSAEHELLENIISNQKFILTLLKNFITKLDLSTQKSIIHFLLTMIKTTKNEDIKKECLEVIASMFPKTRDKDSKAIDAKDTKDTGARNLDHLIEVLMEEFRVDEDEYLSMHHRIMEIFVGLAAQLSPQSYKEKVYPVLLNYLKQIIQRRNNLQNGFLRAVCNRALFYYLFRFEKILSLIDHEVLSSKDEEIIYEILKPDFNDYLKPDNYDFSVQNGEFALLPRLFPYIDKIEIQNNLLRVLCHNLIKHSVTKTIVPQGEEDDSFAIAERILKTLIANNLTPNQLQIVFTEINLLLLTGKIETDPLTILPVLSMQSTLIGLLANHDQIHFRLGQGQVLQRDLTALREAFVKFSESPFTLASWRMMLMLMPYQENPASAHQIIYNKLVALVSSGFTDQATSVPQPFIHDEFFIKHPKEIAELFAHLHKPEYHPEKIALITLFKKCLEVPNQFKEFAMIGLHILLAPQHSAAKDFTSDATQKLVEEHLDCPRACTTIMSFL